MLLSHVDVETTSTSTASSTASTSIGWYGGPTGVTVNPSDDEAVHA
jgi:hypothetical protein